MQVETQLATSASNQLAQASRPQPLSPVQPLPSGIFKRFITHMAAIPRMECETCCLHLIGMAIRVPGVKGVYCSSLCLEQGLFYDRSVCRACGSGLDKGKYCSDDCRRAFASEPLGSGRRFVAWLARKQPALFQEIQSVPAN